MANMFKAAANKPVVAPNLRDEDFALVKPVTPELENSHSETDPTAPKLTSDTFLPQKKPHGVQTSVYLDKDVSDKLNELVKKTKTSKSVLVSNMLRYIMEEMK